MNAEFGSRTEDTPLSGFTVEGIEIARLGMDPEKSMPTPLMLACCAAIGGVVPEPNKVFLVLAGNLVESIKSRLPMGQYRNSFDDERGAGILAAKTLNVGEDIHIVLPAGLFELPEAAREAGNIEHARWLEESAEWRELHVKRTVLHEAQHAAMSQAGEKSVSLEGVGWARGTFLSLADTVIDEYRAELGVPEQYREPFETTLPIVELDAARNAMTRIAMVDYQSHLDVGLLAQDIVAAVQHPWKALGNVAAARRVAGIAMGTPFSDEETVTDAWSLMVEPHWLKFEQILRNLPQPAEKGYTYQVRRAVEDLADLFAEWLRAYGFLWRDVKDNSEFLIESTHLLL